MISEIYYSAGASDAFSAFFKEAAPLPVLKPAGLKMHNVGGGIGAGGAGMSPQSVVGAHAMANPTVSQTGSMTAPMPQGAGTVAGRPSNVAPSGALDPTVTRRQTPGPIANTPTNVKPLPAPAPAKGPSAQFQTNLAPVESTQIGGGHIPNNVIQHAQLAPQQAAAMKQQAGDKTTVSPPPAAAQAAAQAAAPAAAPAAAGAPTAAPAAAPAEQKPGFWQAMKDQAPSALLNTGLMMGVPMMMNAFSNNNNQQQGY